MDMVRMFAHLLWREAQEGKAHPLFVQTLVYKKRTNKFTFNLLVFMSYENKILL